MEQKDRKLILDNLTKLVSKTTNFEQIFNILKEKKMFNKHMIEEIQSNSHKVKFFYKYVTTRGPTAFEELKEALRQTHNHELVNILTHGRSCTVILQGNGFNGPTLEEEYPYDQMWHVAVTKERFDFNRREVYKMDSRPKGLLLIINTRTFVNQIKDERLGSEHDVSRLESIFSQLGYEIVIPENKHLTAEDIRSEVERFSQRKEHEYCDSSIVFVMSHGKSNANKHIEIYGWDSLTVNSEDLINNFSARKCPGLRDKPKLFFFQSCRGTQFQYPVFYSETNSVNEAKNSALLHTESEEFSTNGNLQNDGQRMPPSEYVRNTSDVLIGYSTAPEYVSHRDPETGSWYIQTLCRMLAKYAASKDIQSILTLIRNYEKMKEKDEQEIVSISWTRLLGLNKAIYFQPGVYEDDIFAPSLLPGS